MNDQVALMTTTRSCRIQHTNAHRCLVLTYVCTLDASHAGRVASRWHLGCIITGQTNVKQLEEYLGAFSLTLDEETMKEVEAIHMQNRCPEWKD